MSLEVFLAFQLSLLPLQALFFLGVYNERKRTQMMLRFAVLKLATTRR